MIIVEQSVLINRPVEEVFIFMSEAENLFKWSRDVEEIEQLTPGPVKVGSRFEIVSRFLGRRVPVVLEVTEFIPYSRVSSRSEEGQFKLESTTTYQTEGENTRITATSRIVPMGYWKVVEPLLPAIIRRRSARDYRALQRILGEAIESAGRVEMKVLSVSEPVICFQK